MNEKHHRYPGAQPFSDDEFSRRIFFGREKASVALTDQILANRLVVVYAKSGSGKTSLLNAGVAPRLREALHVPLFIRVNDRKRGPLASVFEGIRSECERQKLEYVAGDTSSLWSFFKTVEFWRDDVLQTPVLILDQFEELFTLQQPEQREQFLTELGSLLRGTPPTGHDADATGVSIAPPAIRVVLSLREDFLGLLDEGSDRIPEIMDHRYRLAPLSADVAGKAITGPAALEAETLTTRAFQLQPECVSSIVNYLSRSAANREDGAARQVEPFHLQLICQLIESVAAFKQKTSAAKVVLSFDDIGGEAALAQTLVEFYADAINSLPRKRRRAARRMCAHLLISVEGRRLSVDERELCRHSRLGKDDLGQLLERRLLRTDRRSDRTYYELGHDALVQPALASRRTQDLITYTLAIFGGSIVCASMTVSLIALLAVLLDSHNTDDKVYVPVFGVICIFIGIVGWVWLRAGIRLRTRYGEHEGSEAAEVPQRRLRRLRRLAGWALIFIAPAICLVWFIVGLCWLTVSAAAVLWHGHLPSQLALLSSSAANTWPKMQNHPFTDLVWVLLEYACVVWMGAVLYHQAGKLLWPSVSPNRRSATALRALKRVPSLIPPGLRLLAGAVGLVPGVLGLFTLRTCSNLWHGEVAHWLQWPIMTDRLPETCSTQFTHYLFFSWDGVNLFAFFVALIVLSIAALWSGLAGMRSVVVWLRGTKQRPRPLEILALAACCALPLLILTPFARALWSAKPPAGVDVWVAGSGMAAHSTEGGSNWNLRFIKNANFESMKATSSTAATAVGVDGGIWHTLDGGKTWTQVQWGQGDHKGTTLEGLFFATPQHGWIVGQKQTLLKTEDGGNSWQQLNISNDLDFHGVQDMFDVWFTSDHNGWMAARKGIIVHTNDGGHTWQMQHTPLEMDLIFIAFATSQCGWTTGSNGTLFHTVDGGQTWTTEVTGSKLGLDGIAAVSCTSAWVVGDKGTILHTIDGGTTWTPQTSRVASHLYEVSFVDDKAGWAVGADGVILRTSNAGQTWLLEHEGSANDISAVIAAKR